MSQSSPHCRNQPTAAPARHISQLQIYEFSAKQPSSHSLQLRLQLLHRSIGASIGNNMTFRIEWDKILWHHDRLLLARLFAEVLADEIEHRPPCHLPRTQAKENRFDSYLTQ